MTPEETTELIDKILKHLDMKNPNELAGFIDVERSVVYRWKSRGFPRGTGNIIKLLVDKLEVKASTFKIG